jgi:hypothetical protein
MQSLESKGSWAPRAAIIGGLLCFGAMNASAQVLTVSGSPATMRISTAIAGQAPTSITEATTTYTTKTNNKNQPKKITARLNSVMPPGMTLTLTMAPPTNAVSYGPVTLDATTRDVVGSITNTNQFTGAVTYVISATAGAGVVAPQSRTVTLTITAWP